MVGVIGVVILGGVYLICLIFCFIVMVGLCELFIVIVLLFVVGIVFLMFFVGVFVVLGIFFVGVVFVNLEYCYEFESDIDLFCGFLFGLFFMIVGVGINFMLLFENFVLIIGLIVGLILLKIVIFLIFVWIFKLCGGDKWFFGLGFV